jgi:Pro-kumamolisin, activation domain
LAFYASDLGIRAKDHEFRGYRIAPPGPAQITQIDGGEVSVHKTDHTSRNLLITKSIMEETVPIPGSERKRTDESKYVEPTPEDDFISVSLLIRSPPDSLPIPDLDHWQTTVVGEQHFISSDEYAKIYGSLQSELDKVVKFVERHGMTVLDSHTGRRMVKAQGTAKQIHAAFGVKLSKYESPLPQSRKKSSDRKTHIHHGFDGPVHIPRDLSDIVIAVIGLDNRSLGAPAIPSGDPPFTDGLLAPTIAGYYNFPNAHAADQVIALIEFEPTGYLKSDYTKRYFPSMPPGYDTIPSIHGVSLMAGATNEGAATISSDEVCVDISVAGTIAQGATINVYFGISVETGWVDFLTRILVPGTEAQPTVVSISWIIVDDGSIGSPTVPGTLAYIMTNLFQHIAYQGINVFNGSGDWGASDAVAGIPAPHVGYPTSDPWVTSCGGTVLGNPHGSPTKFDEWVWNPTGGGSSSIFPIPPYQTAAGITQIEDSNGKTYTNRFVPDIAGMNIMTGFFLDGSPMGPVGGTSLVGPLYAGLTAVVRSALGIRIGPLNPILYALRDDIFHDITVGNNDPGNGSAYFSANTGYDACTGWGSIHGTKFLNAVAKLYFPRLLQFVVANDTYTLEKVDHAPLYPTAFTLVLEGFTPNAVGSHRPTLTGPFSTLPNVSVTVGPPVPEFPLKHFTPQNISYACSIDFTKPAIHTLAHGGVFPQFGEPPILETLGATITLLGDTVLAADTIFKLVSGPDWHKHEDTGKVTGLIYDRFGYFDGFLLMTKEGKEKWFGSEKNAENLIRFAWEKKALISVLDHHHPHSPNAIILRRLPDAI